MIKYTPLLLLLACSEAPDFYVANTRVHIEHEATPWVDFLEVMHYMREGLVAGGWCDEVEAERIFDITLRILPPHWPIPDGEDGDGVVCEGRINGRYWYPTTILVQSIPFQSALYSSLIHEFVSHRYPHVVYGVHNAEHSPNWIPAEIAVTTYVYEALMGLR